MSKGDYFLKLPKGDNILKFNCSPCLLVLRVLTNSVSLNQIVNFITDNVNFNSFPDIFTCLLFFQTKKNKIFT